MTRQRFDGPGDTALWITRMDRGGEYDRNVGTLHYRGDGARSVFKQATRVVAMTRAELGPAALRRGDLIVTLMEEGGDTSTDDDPLRVPREKADWFLHEWLHCPKSWCSSRGRNL